MKVQRKTETWRRPFQDLVAGDVFAVSGSVLIAGKIESANNLVCLALHREGWSPPSSSNAVTLEAGLPVVVPPDKVCTLLHGAFMEDDA